MVVPMHPIMPFILHYPLAPMKLNWLAIAVVDILYEF